MRDGRGLCPLFLENHANKGLKRPGPSLAARTFLFRLSVDGSRVGFPLDLLTANVPGPRGNTRVWPAGLPPQFALRPSSYLWDSDGLPAELIWPVVQRMNKNGFGSGLLTTLTPPTAEALRQPFSSFRFKKLNKMSLAPQCCAGPRVNGRVRRRGPSATPRTYETHPPKTLTNSHRHP